MRNYSIGNEGIVIHNLFECIGYTSGTAVEHDTSGYSNLKALQDDGKLFVVPLTKQMIMPFEDDEQVDVLSLNCRGGEYWHLKDMKMRPRVIAVAYNKNLGNDRYITMPRGKNWDGKSDYYGASFPALQYQRAGHKSEGNEIH